jgi:hypothetical protein
MPHCGGRKEGMMMWRRGMVGALLVLAAVVLGVIYVLWVTLSGDGFAPLLAVVLALVVVGGLLVSGGARK